MNKRTFIAALLVTAMLTSPLSAQMDEGPMNGGNQAPGEKTRGEFKRGRMRPGMGDEMKPGMENGKRPGMEGKENFLLDKLLENPELQKELGLTAEQLNSLKTGLDEIAKKEIDLRAELEKAGIDQARQMISDNADEEAIMALIDKTGAIRIELAKLRVKKVLLIKKAIPPELLQNIREKMRDKIRERKGEFNQQEPGSPGQREKFREEMKRRHSGKPAEDGEGPEEEHR